MESGAPCVRSVSAEKKRLLAIFLWVFHGRGIAHLPTMFLWSLTLLMLPPRSPVYEKLYPSPQAALQRVPVSFPPFSLLSYSNSPPHIFPDHRPHQVDGFMILYTPKDRAEGALICCRREWKLHTGVLKMCPSNH